jgi:hypothetical protein
MSVIMFSMWTEAIKNFAEAGKGNVIFLDGSSDGMQRTMQQLMSFSNKSSMFSILPDDAGDIKK